MSQWSVRVRVVKHEIWTVEGAESEEEALARAAAGDTVDEQFSDLVDWEPLSATEDN